MDVALIAYTASIFAALLAIDGYAHWGVAEVHTYTIPPHLEERGYSPRIVANQVVDAMRRIEVAVASLDETEFVVQGQVRPIGEVASYLGIVELIRASEGMLGLGPKKIEIEITQNAGMAHWRVRGEHAVRGYQVSQGDLALGDPDALVDEVAQQAVGFVSPFEALAYQFIGDAAAHDYDATVAVASGLLLDCERRRAWVCTDANLKNAYLLRGMAYLYSDRSVRAFDDFNAANRIGVETALGVAFYGDAFAARGEEEQAQRQYAKANRIDPAIGRRFYELAKGYARGGNYRLADRRYTTAADLGMDSEAFLVDWGDTLSAIGWYDAALEKYQLAEAADPKSDLYADRIDRTLASRKAARASEPADKAAANPRVPPPQD